MIYGSNAVVNGWMYISVSSTSAAYLRSWEIIWNTFCTFSSFASIVPIIDFAIWLTLYTLGSGFGSGNTASPFSANRTGFGNTTNTTSGGGLFGSNTATSGPSTGFGGFGSNTNNANTSGGIFGAANKPAFGAQNNSSGGLFGGGTGGNTFGQSNQSTSGFGNSLGNALGTNTTECQGTGNVPFQAFSEKDPAAGSVNNHYQTVSCMPAYKNFSVEVSGFAL